MGVLEYIRSKRLPKAPAQACMNMCYVGLGSYNISTIPGKTWPRPLATPFQLFKGP